MWKLNKLGISAAISLILPASLLASPAVAANCDASSFSSGAGTSADRFVVLTATQFRNIQACDGVQKYFSIQADIDLQNSAFTPFGSGSYFVSDVKGEVFDGTNTRSAIVQGLNVNTSRAGLVGTAGSGAKLQNLQIIGSVVGSSYTGGLIGLAEPDSANGQIRIENVITSIDVTSTATQGVGGLVGFFGSSSFPTGTLVISGSHTVYSQGKGVVTANNASEVGGLLGYARFATKVDIDNSTTNTVLNNKRSGGDIGGLIGAVAQVQFEIYRSGSSSVINLLPAADTSTGADLGGLVGVATADTTKTIANVIDESYFSGLLRFRGRGSVGGMVGSVALDSLGKLSNTVRNSYVTGTIIQDLAVLPANNAAVNVGGFFGYTGDAISVDRLLLNSQISVDSSIPAGAVYGKVNDVNQSHSSSNLFYNSSAEAANAGAVGRTGLTGTGNISTMTGGTSINSSQLASQATFPNFSGVTWAFCDAPYLLWQGSDGCYPTITGSRISPEGTEIEVFFSVPVNPIPGSGSRYPSQNVFGVRVNNSAVTLSSPILASTTSRSVLLPLPALVIGEDVVEFSYTDPSTSDETQSQAMESLVSGFDVKTRSYILSANTSVAGPQAVLGSSVLAPTSLDVPLTCDGSCGPGDSYTYVASITPVGGSPTTISGTANSTTTTLSFTALSPNVAHTIQASVTYNGQTSATVSTTVTTQRPIATISSVAVTETTAILGVGCTNCGAAPDSFSISATPQAGGAAITSNTSVITGLSPETTYSFAVVIAYAGTTSLSVNYQGNPVRTNPYAPTVTLVSPSSGPLTGGAVTLTGTNLSTSSEVRIGTTTVSFTVVNGTTITFTAPSSTAGAKDIRVTNPAGAGTLPSAYTYVAGPNLTSISPAIATVNGGTIVTLTGTDLSTATQVNLGNTTVSVTVVSNTKVRFVTPATSAGTVDVGIKTTGGVATLSAALEFTSSALVPVITSITPTSGTTAGGTTITVTGQYFSGSYSDSVSAAVDGISGSSVVVVDDSTLTFVTPAHAAATSLDVTVLVGGELGTLIGAFSYTAPASNNSSGGSNSVSYTGPEIIDFSIRIIYADGGKVTITGKRLGSISSMKLGGVSVTLLDNTDTSATFETSDLPIGVWDLYLANTYGQLTFQQAIQVISPQLSSTGELLGYKWTLKFIGNSRVLNSDQTQALKTVAKKYGNAETVICWGYTTAAQPKQWAVTHATARAEAACSMLAKELAVKTVIRLRYGVEKSWAMRAAIQFWKQEN